MRTTGKGGALGGNNHKAMYAKNEYNAHRRQVNRQVLLPRAQLSMVCGLRRIQNVLAAKFVYLFLLTF